MVTHIFEISSHLIRYDPLDQRHQRSILIKDNLESNGQLSQYCGESRGDSRAVARDHGANFLIRSIVILVSNV